MQDKIFHLKQWSPKIIEVADSLKADINEVAPELEVLFMGAGALGLPGKNDIDLDILCDVKNLDKYTAKLKKVLGEPKKQTDKLAVWEFTKEGFEVDCILSDPSISHVPEQRRVFETLRARPDLLEEYRQLKVKFDGLPYSDYENAKKQFFQKILG